jgi:ATP-dependent helicase/nuclease subunit A
VEGALSGLGAAWEEEAPGGPELRLGDRETFVKAAARAEPRAIADPDWLHVPAPVESRPPRPLAPSALGEDDVADPPPSPALRGAAERGRLLHRLFERLPDVPPAERAARAAHWLEHAAGVADPAARASIVADAVRVVSDPVHAALFGPEALAEAPIAAVVAGGIVVAGTVDRLLVEEGRVVIAEFKTGRRVPATLAEVPIPHLRQVAHYAAALAVIFPGREIQAKLLYTSGPRLFDLPPALVARYAPQPLEAAAAAS